MFCGLALRQVFMQCYIHCFSWSITRKKNPPSARSERRGNDTDCGLWLARGGLASRFGALRWTTLVLRPYGSKEGRLWFIIVDIQSIMILLQDCVQVLSQVHLTANQRPSFGIASPAVPHEANPEQTMENLFCKCFLNKCIHFFGMYFDTGARTLVHSRSCVENKTSDLLYQ